MASETERTLGLALKSLPGGPDVTAIQPLVASLRKALTTQTDEQVTQELTDLPSYLTLGGAVHMAPGEEISTQIELPLSIGATTLPAKLTMKGLPDTPEGHGRMYLTSLPDPAAMTRAIATLLDSILQSVPEAARAAVHTELKRFRLEVQETTEIEYDRATGVSVSVLRTKLQRLGDALQREEQTTIKMIR